MFSGLAAGIAKIAIEAVLATFGDVLKDMFKTWRAEKTAEQLGQRTTERDQARAGEAAAIEIGKKAAEQLDEDDAIAQMKAGTA